MRRPWDPRCLLPAFWLPEISGFGGCWARGPQSCGARLHCLALSGRRPRCCRTHLLGCSARWTPGERGSPAQAASLQRLMMGAAAPPGRAKASKLPSIRSESSPQRRAQQGGSPACALPAPPPRRRSHTLPRQTAPFPSKPTPPPPSLRAEQLAGHASAAAAAAAAHGDA